MKKIKGIKILSESGGEIEYQLSNGLIVSVIDLQHPIMKNLYRITGNINISGENYSVELVEYVGNTRYILEKADTMNFKELKEYCKEKNKINSQAQRMFEGFIASSRR